jgi:hypothetical protein
VLLLWEKVLLGLCAELEDPVAWMELEGFVWVLSKWELLDLGMAELEVPDLVLVKSELALPLDVSFEALDGDPVILLEWLDPVLVELVLPDSPPVVEPWGFVVVPVVWLVLEGFELVDDVFDMTRELDEVLQGSEDVVTIFDELVDALDELECKLLEDSGAWIISNDALETIVFPSVVMVVGFLLPVSVEGWIVKVYPSVVRVVTEPTLGIVTVSNLEAFSGAEECELRAKVVVLRANASRTHDCRSNGYRMMSRPSLEEWITFNKGTCNEDSPTRERKESKRDQFERRESFDGQWNDVCSGLCGRLDL